MTQPARWIRFGPLEPLELRAACRGIAVASPARGAPATLWAQAKTQEDGYLYAVVAPRRLAPGRPSRWCAWALSPAVATCRDFGLRAYLNGPDICLHGRRIAGGEAAEIGECAVVASSLKAMVGWAGCGEAPAGWILEAALRARIEAQFGWQFDTSWPTAAERAAIAQACVPELCESPGW